MQKKLKHKMIAVYAKAKFKARVYKKKVKFPIIR